MNEELKALISLRHMEETDHAFIYATWLRGLYYGNSFFAVTEKDEFMERYQLVITNLLFRPSVEVRVACLQEDADTILGYSVLEKFSVPHGTTIHWTFVKPEWRKQGIATALIPGDAQTITHIVDSLLNLKRKDKAKSDRYLSNYDVKLKNRKLKYKPFLL